MKLSVERKQLSEMLSKTVAAVQKRNTIPILANIAWTAGDGVLTIRATDLDIEVTTSCQCEVAEYGTTTMSAVKLQAIVASIPAGRMIDFELKDHVMHIKSGTAKFKIETMPIDDFPELASHDYDATFTAKAHEVKRLFGLSKIAMCDDSAKYYLQGVYLHSVDGHVRAVATDGHKLALVADDALEAEFPGVIIPAKTVVELDKIIDIGDVTISISDTKARFVSGSTTIVTKVIDGVFPDYTRVIPKDSGNTFTAKASDMKMAAQLVAVVNDDKVRKVTIDVADGVAVLTSRGNGANEAREEVSGTVQGKPVSVGINSKYLADIMAQCSGSDATWFFGSTTDAPIKIKPDDDDGVVYVVMGMR